MSGIFSPKAPKIPEPIKPPTIDDARQADEELMRLRKRRGLASTFLVRQGPRRGAAAQLTEGAAVSMVNSNNGGARAVAGGGDGLVGKGSVGRVSASSRLL